MQADLWTFAVSLYQRPGVAEDLLALQDDHGANVCLLLCGIWLEQRGVPCTATHLSELEAVAGEWSATVVEALRHLRRQWREMAQRDTDLATLREAVKALELQGEKILLTRLALACQAWPTSEEPTQWLEALAPAPHGLAQGDSRSALERLRAAVPGA